ncbi:MAG TPA: ankyrin repeat domain-containing protein [Gemmatimonadaceae bacterium]|nr:ankyrin repeat domain-containing protein [Gemmatimonadaceae bacterium]
MKSLPARPSLESLHKQAKKLARDIAAGDAAAIARARAHLPNLDLPLTQRNAQLIIAREYGFAGWQDLTAEVSKRLGHGLDWAATQAKRAIHDNDLERLKQLLVEYPGLLSWQADDDHNGLLGFATGAYGDAFGEERERWFTRKASAELLIDAGAVVTQSVCEGLLESRAVGLLELFQRKALLPRTLAFFAALDDIDAVRKALAENANDLATVNAAFITACRFAHEPVASLLLERAIVLDPDLGNKIDDALGRVAFVKDLVEKTPLDPRRAIALGPWKTFVIGQVDRAMHERDLTAFVAGVQREPWLLGDEYVDLQQKLIANATQNGQGEFIVALLDLRPAILRTQPPASQAIEMAFTYGHTHLLPLLARIWSIPNDLPHAAGLGDLARVRHWFGASGEPALGDVQNQYPSSSYMPKFRVEEYARQWGPISVQRVLDSALAFAVINRHFDVADFLLAHGANINTHWNSHEPASILHHLVFEDNYESMQYLIDRGIDLTIKDYRWNSTAHGWALYGKHDEKMARWLEDADRRRHLAADGKDAPQDA